MTAQFAKDPRLATRESPRWRHGQKQALQRLIINPYEPFTKSESKYEFILHNNNVLVFGPLTGFLVEGCFECQEEATEASASPQWATVPASDYDKVVVQPNWFEHLVKSVTVSHEGTLLKPHDVPPGTEPFIQTYVYSMMHPMAKKLLCAEACHPGNAVPVTNPNGWSVAAQSDWHKYSQSIFGKDQVEFRWNPPFTFPFFQGTEFSMQESACLPMPMLGTVNVTVALHETTEQIFKKVEGNKKKYRFRLTKMELVVMEASLNNAYEKQLLSQKRAFNYPGVTMLGTYENINAGTNTGRIVLNTPLPEGLFIVAFHKDALGGDYKFSSAKEPSEKVFLHHNIASLDITFDHKSLYFKEPNFGTLGHHLVSLQQLADYLEHPPFGIQQNPDRLIFEDIKGGNKSTLFPHLYLNLCPSGKESRIIPYSDDGGILSKNGKLTLFLKFQNGGAPDNAVFAVYAFFTDNNMRLEPASKKFCREYVLN